MWELASGINSCQLFRMQRRPASSQQKLCFLWLLVESGVQTLSISCTDSSPRTPGVSKIVTVDVKGSAPLWMKIKDLADGVTYNFRIRAKTLTYGPEVEANITTGPGEGGTLVAVIQAGIKYINDLFF